MADRGNAVSCWAKHPAPAFRCIFKTNVFSRWNSAVFGNFKSAFPRESQTEMNDQKYKHPGS
ncbi:unnamed protein product, partial [Ceratitis capitata]